LGPAKERFVSFEKGEPMMKSDKTCFAAALDYIDRDRAALALCPPIHRGVDGFH
jgi:hypothetical protein